MLAVVAELVEERMTGCLGDIRFRIGQRYFIDSGCPSRSTSLAYNILLSPSGHQTELVWDC
jgi:hypothetical protein